MTHQTQTTALDQITELLAEHGFDGLAPAVTVLLNEVMKIERSHALGAAPYQRSEHRTGHANGFKPRTLHTRLGPLTVEVPQTRGVEFYPSALEKGIRSERALKLAVAEMYVQGVSTRKVAAITEKLCGLEVTSSPGQPGRRGPRRGAGEVAGPPAGRDALPDPRRPLRERPPRRPGRLLCRAGGHRHRHGGQAVDPRGERLAVGGRGPLAGLPGLAPGPGPARGRSWSSATPTPGCKEALEARLTGVPWQRCQFHLIENAMAFVPRPAMRKEVVAGIRAVFDAPDRPEAERQLEIAVKKYRATAPKLAEWLEANVPEGLTVFALPPSHRRRLRTINMLERLNKEMKRRTRVAGLFPNEASALRLVSAVAMEISEEWETNRKYLTMGPD